MSSAVEDAEMARDLGGELRRRRRQLGMDQRALALVSGVSRSSVVAAEGGKVTLRLDVLIRICRALGVHLIVAPDQPRADA